KRISRIEYIVSEILERFAMHNVGSTGGSNHHLSARPVGGIDGVQRGIDFEFRDRRSRYGQTNAGFLRLIRDAGSIHTVISNVVVVAAVAGKSHGPLVG